MKLCISVEHRLTLKATPTRVTSTAATKTASATITAANVASVAAAELTMTTAPRAIAMRTGTTAKAMRQ